MEPVHKVMMADIDYQIAEARKNASMHNQKAATLEHLKELFERRIREHETMELNALVRSQADGDVKP
jgi:hypothetical protein